MRLIVSIFIIVYNEEKINKKNTLRHKSQSIFLYLNHDGVFKKNLSNINAFDCPYNIHDTFIRPLNRRTIGDKKFFCCHFVAIYIDI